MRMSETTSERGAARLLTVAGVVAIAALAGCSPAGGTKAVSGGSKAVDVVLTGGNDVGTFIARAHPNPGTLHDAAAGLADLTGDAQAIKAKFDRIAASDDPFGEALVTATCSGLTHVAEQDREHNGNVLPPSAQDWQAYLNDEVARLLPLRYAAAVPGRVEQFNTAAQLASINPRAAYVYAEQCVLGRR
ncbi:MAG TPA: hypothetical protein VEX67_12540 [Solirubrobacteraceae bacterium]|nr:hypothetical protein [Solirubrobacteraceae bacterium]